MATKKRSKRKKLWFIIGGMVVVAVAALAVGMSGSGDKRTEVQADLAVTDEISEVVTASGRIQPKTKVDIVAEVSAQIVELFVKEGDRVVKGQRLLLLDTIQYKSDVSQARYLLDETTARTEAARAQSDLKKVEFEQQSRLFEQDLTSETAFNNAAFAYENATANHEAWKAQMRTGRARLEKAEDNLSKTLITAPMEGIITFLSVEVGEIAQAQTSFMQGRALMTISDLSVFEVDVDVDETEIAKVVLDQPVEIRVDAFRDTTFEGTVAEIGNSATVTGQGTDNFTTSFRVTVRFAETEATLRPGMSATVDVTTARAEDALLVPYAAVVTREFDADSVAAEETGTDKGSSLVATAKADEIDDAAAEDTTAAESPKKKKKKVKKSGVFLIRNGEATFVEVETGIADERNIVAISGVADGDTVISGSFQTLRKLEEGETVEIDERSLEKMKGDDE